MPTVTSIQSQTLVKMDKYTVPTNTTEPSYRQHRLKSHAHTLSSKQHTSSSAMEPKAYLARSFAIVLETRLTPDLKHLMLAKNK